MLTLYNGSLNRTRNIPFYSSSLYVLAINKADRPLSRAALWPCRWWSELCTAEEQEWREKKDILLHVSTDLWKHHFKWAYILKSAFAVLCGCNNPAVMSLMDIECMNERIELSNMVDVVNLNVSS